MHLIEQLEVPASALQSHFLQSFGVRLVPVHKVQRARWGTSGTRGQKSHFGETPQFARLFMRSVGRASPKKTNHIITFRIYIHPVHKNSSNFNVRTFCQLARQFSDMKDQIHDHFQLAIKSRPRMKSRPRQSRPRPRPSRPSETKTETIETIETNFNNRDQSRPKICTM